MKLHTKFRIFMDSLKIQGSTQDSAKKSKIYSKFPRFTLKFQEDSAKFNERFRDSKGFIKGSLKDSGSDLKIL